MESKSPQSVVSEMASGSLIFVSRSRRIGGEKGTTAMILAGDRAIGTLLENYRYSTREL